MPLDVNRLQLQLGQQLGFYREGGGGGRKKKGEEGEGRERNREGGREYLGSGIAEGRVRMDQGRRIARLRLFLGGTEAAGLGLPSLWQVSSHLHFLVYSM